MGRIKVTKKAAFIPVFSSHNPWDCQIGFSINVLIVSESHKVWWQPGLPVSWRKPLEQELQRRENVQVQEPSPPEPGHPWPWPQTPSPAWPCFIDSFLTAAGCICKGNPLSGSPMPNPWLSFLWWPGFSPPPSHFLLLSSLATSLDLFSLEGI